MPARWIAQQELDQAMLDAGLVPTEYESPYHAVWKTKDSTKFLGVPDWGPVSGDHRA
jgi:hypothetical protein